MADQVLHSGVRSITDLMVLPGLIKTRLRRRPHGDDEMGKAMMGTGEATGEGRALMAAENAIQNPLLDEVTLKGAKAVLVNITGGLDMTLLEVDEAANAISAQVDPEANIIFGAAFDPTLSNTLRVSVVATGMDVVAILGDRTGPAPHVAPRRQPQAIAPEPMPSRCRNRSASWSRCSPSKPNPSPKRSRNLRWPTSPSRNQWLSKPRR